jgi:hypothetical protein
MLADQAGELPRLVLRSPDQLEQLLRRVERLIARDPVVARSLIGALVAEGRRFAATPDGRRWQASLARSPLVRQGRLVWQAAGLNRLTATFDRPALLPSDWLRLTADALTSANLEAVLSRCLLEEAEDAAGGIDPAPLGERLR